MDEKTEFTVSDRRKFTTEGELREGASTPASEPSKAEAEKPAAENVVSMPRREQPAAQPAEPATQPQTGQPEGENEGETRIISEEESAQQHAAYRDSSDKLDQMLKQANPGMEDSGPVTFEHVIQSIYLSAMIAMGAGTEQGQKPRIDILGARQSIDMLSVLQEKTKNNLVEREQRMLQSALFELRMAFLEITNAIAQSAQQQPPKGQG